MEDDILRSIANVNEAVHQLDDVPSTSPDVSYVLSLNNAASLADEGQKGKTVGCKITN